MSAKASAATTLVALRCIQCDTPLTAQPGEIAWTCANCTTGQRIDLATGLVPQRFHFHKELKPGKHGRPFWVASGDVQLNRETYGFGGRGGESQRFWSTARRFFIPAFAADVDTLVDTVSQYLNNPRDLAEGPAESYLPIVVPQDDIQALAEYVILGIEAQRNDDVKQIAFTLKLAEPELWILP